MYRTQKFIRRHRLGVFAAAAVTASLVGGLIVSFMLLVRERSAHDRAMIAEKQEMELRRQAEVTGATEVKRAARTALDLANRNLADDRVADGLAYLVYAARKDPGNPTLGRRLISALTTHNFLLPEGPAFDCGSRVLAVRFTLDGQSLYVGTEDGTFRILDATSGRLRREFRLGQPVMIAGWEFPRNNDTVFAARFVDNTLGVFDVESGKRRWTPLALGPNVWAFQEHLTLGHAAGISPDGRWLYALSHDRFWIWDAATSALLLHSIVEKGLGGCDFNSAGTEVAVTVGGIVRRWTLPEARPLAMPLTPEPSKGGNEGTVAFSPDGRRLALAVLGNGIHLLEAATGKLLRTLPPPGDYIVNPSVAFPSNTRVFGTGLREAGAWEVATGEFRRMPVAVGTALLSAVFDAAGRRVLTTGTDGYARLCDLETGELVTELAWRQDRDFYAALAPDGGRVAIGTASGTLQRLRPGRGAARPLIIPLVAHPFFLASPFLPESPTRFWWMNRDRTRVLDAASGRETAGGFTHPEPVTRLGFASYHSPVRSDLRFMVVQVGQGWQAWELGPSGVIQVATLDGASNKVGVVKFSPREDLVVICFAGTGEMGVWNLRTGARAGPAFHYPTTLVYMTPNFSPDGRRLALGAADGAAMIIDVATARRVVPLATRHMVPNQGVLFSPDGTRVVTSSIRSETRVWDAATGEPVSDILHTTDARGSVQYSPDGRWFATWGQNTTNLWEGRTGAQVGETIPAGGRLIRFSQDSRNLATVSDDGTVRVWDAPSGQPSTEPMRHGPGRVGFPEFSPDGRFLRTEGKTEYHFWSVPPRLPDGMPVPDWLLRLATICATKIVNDAGQLVDAPEALSQFDEVRRQIAALPSDSPLADWGRWFLDDRADRSLAPGFTLTPAEAAKLAATLAGEIAATR